MKNPTFSVPIYNSKKKELNKAFLNSSANVMIQPKNITLSNSVVTPKVLQWTKILEVRVVK